MLKFGTSKRYVPNKAILALVLIITFLFTIFPLTNLKNTAIAKPFANPSPVEVIEKRTEKSKTFDNGDGTFTTKFYLSPIHFLNNGIWQDIDSKIKPSDNGDFENGSNRFKARFAGHGQSDDLTSYEFEGLKATFSFKGIPNLGGNYYSEASDVVPQVKDNSITYVDIFPDVDLRQVVINNGIKEDIILKKYSGKNSFVYLLKMTGVDAVKENDGSIGFYKKGQANTQKVFYIPKPFMVDSAIDPNRGEGVRSDNVTQDVIQRGSNIYVAITADDNWLKAPERQWPVYIDPTINGDPVTFDSYVASAYPNSNYYFDWNASGGYYQLKSGYYDSSTGYNETFIKFNTSSLNGKWIWSSTFRIYVAHSYYFTIRTPVWLDSVNSSWDSPTITWYNRPTNTTNIGSVNVEKDDWAQFDVTNVVKNWAAGAQSNGFKLHEYTYGAEYWKKFRASENTTNIPELVVTYSDVPAAPTGTAYGNVANSGNGYVNLSWTPVSGATGYKVSIFNGSYYEDWDVGNVTTWTTQNKKIWPTKSEIASGRYTLHHDSLGTELADDPRQVYTNAGGSYANYQNYWFRVKAYNSYGDSPISNAFMPTLPDRTSPPVVLPVSISETNGTNGSTNSSSIAASWNGVTDTTTGTNSGTSYYKVDLTRTDPNTNATTSSTVNVTHTGTGSYSYTFNNQPNNYRYQAVVTAYDNNGNYSSQSYLFRRSNTAYQQAGNQVGVDTPRFETGKFGQALTVEEGTTNILSVNQATIETSTSGWTPWNNSSISRDTSQHWQGTASLKHVTTVPGDNYVNTQAFTVSPNTKYSYGADVKIPTAISSGAAVLRVIQWTSGGSFASDTTYDSVTSTSGWQRLNATFQTASNTGYVELRLHISGVGTAYWDGIQFEQKAYPTSFSDSPRSSEALIIPTTGTVSPSQGTVEAWVYVNNGIRDGSANRYIFSVGTASSPYPNTIGLRHRGDNYWSFFTFDGAGNMSDAAIPDTLTTGWHLIGGRWSGTDVALFIDGVKQTSVASPRLPSSLPSTANIGSWIGAGYGWINTQVDDLRISTVARSDSDVLAGFSRNQPLPVDRLTSFKMDFNGNFNFAADNTLPLGTITAPANNSYLTGTVSITGTASDSNLASYKVEYGAGSSPTTWTLITSSTTPITNGTLASWNTSSLSEGAYTVKLTVTDTAGNSTTTSTLVTKDATLPTGTITAPANNGYVNGTVNIVGTASDTNFNSYKVEYGAGSAPATWNLVRYATTAVTNSNLASWNTSLLGDGQYTIRLTVNDKAGNAKTTSILVRKDATYPIATITSPTGSQYLMGSVTVSGTATDNNFNTYTLEYASQLTPSTWNTVTSSTVQVSGGTLGTWNTTALGNGVYNLRLTVTDKAALTSTSLVSGVTVDNTLPTGSISTPVDSTDVKGTVTVTGTASDTNFSSAKVEYGAGSSPISWTQIASLSTAVTNGTVATWDTTGLVAGTYTLRLTVNDKSGNVTVVTRTVYVDNTHLSAETTNTKITVTWPTVANATGYDIEADGIVIDNGINTMFVHSGLLPDSTHTYRYRAKDQSGNGDWSELLTVKTALTYGVTGPNNVNAGDTFNLAITGNYLTLPTRTVVVTYNAGDAQLVDLSGFTAASDTISSGRITGTNVTVIQNTPGAISFTVDLTIPNGKSWSGVLNILKFTATVSNPSISYAVY